MKQLSQSSKTLLLKVVFAGMMVGLSCAFFYLPLLFGGTKWLMALSGLVLLLPFTFVAYRYPTITILLAIFSGQVMDLEAIPFLPEQLFRPSVGFMRVRFLDPFIFGMVTAVAIKVLRRNSRFRQFIREYPIIVPLCVWLVFQILRSVTEFGINTFGEVRTYYQHLIFVPYVFLFFTTTEKQWQLFSRLSITILLLLLPMSIIKGGFHWGFSTGPYIKWLSASANISVLYAMIAVGLSWKAGLIKLSNRALFLMIIFVVVITIINSHRSNWMALAVMLLVLNYTGRIKASFIAALMLCVLVSFALSFAILDQSGYGIMDFLGQRMSAFTGFREDDTASWRYALWVSAIEKIKESPLMGLGLGLHFQLRGPTGELITTSPHNQYISTTFQIGLIGLIMFIALSVVVLVRLARSYSQVIDPRLSTILITAFVVMLGSHTYFLAYASDLSSWVYGALGLSVLLNLASERRHMRAKRDRERYADYSSSQSDWIES